MLSTSNCVRSEHIPHIRVLVVLSMTVSQVSETSRTNIHHACQQKKIRSGRCTKIRARIHGSVINFLACEQAHVRAQARSVTASVKSSGVVATPPDLFTVRSSRA